MNNTSKTHFSMMSWPLSLVPLIILTMNFSLRQVLPRLTQAMLIIVSIKVVATLTVTLSRSTNLDITATSEHAKVLSQARG
jgi:hypothetical protein